jgi:hypothetical protein
MKQSVAVRQSERLPMIFAKGKSNIIYIEKSTSHILKQISVLISTLSMAIDCTPTLRIKMLGYLVYSPVLA